MIIRRIELVNYCQHVHREINTSGNLVAVVGHNGVGKSNFLGAIQFAITGEQPDKNKSELLHWGAKEGHVVLEFEQDGKPGRIERSVSSNKVTLEYDGVVTSGITNVAKELESRLNVNKDLMRQSVFVRQTEIDSIISAKTDKREREVTFQKLLGLDAAKIHKNLTDWLYAAVKPVSYDIQITEASQRLDDLETRKADIVAEVKSAEAAVADFGTVDESQSEHLSKAIAAVARVLRGKDELSACERNAADRARELEAARAAAGGDGKDPGHDLADLAGQELVVRDELRKIKARDAATAELRFSQEARDAIVAQEHPTAEDISLLEASAESMRTELATVKSEKAIRSKSLAALDRAGPTCPVCRKPLDAGMVSRMREEFAALAEREGELEPRLRDVSASIAKARADLSSWSQGAAVAEARLSAAKAALDSCEPTELTKERADIVLGVILSDAKAQREYEARVAGHKKAIADAELALDVANKAMASARDRLFEAESDARKLCGDVADSDWGKAMETMDSLVSETDKRRARHTELRMAAARAAATRDEIERSLATLSETVASLRASQAEQDALAKRLSVAEHVKDWFHYANGPRVMVTEALGQLTDGINSLLGNFTAPFVVIPDPEQVGFRVEFTDGRDRPPEPPGTNVLSGGERVQLAVAFRLAIYGMFAGRLGLLSLDEPTAYLDDSNVDRFGILLTKVKEIARNMNTQVFMATHERAVIPHMDSVIDLN